MQHNGSEELPMRRTFFVNALLPAMRKHQPAALNSAVPAGCLYTADDAKQHCSTARLFLNSDTAAGCEVPWTPYSIQRYTYIRYVQGLSVTKPTTQ